MLVENCITHHVRIFRENILCPLFGQIKAMAHNLHSITELFCSQFLHLIVSILITSFNPLHQRAIFFKEISLRVPCVNRMTCHTWVAVHHFHEILRQNYIR